MKLKIISDGTNVGTKLIDEDTGETVKGISKLTWQVDMDEHYVTKVCAEFYNIPVEIVSKAEVEISDWNPNNGEMVVTKIIEKNIRVVSAAKGKTSAVSAAGTRIYDNDTGENVGAVQEIKWEATAVDGPKAKVKKIRFGNKDW